MIEVPDALVQQTLEVLSQLRAGQVYPLIKQWEQVAPQFFGQPPPEAEEE